MTPARPLVRPPRPRPATDAPSLGYGVDRSGNLKPSRPAADIAATGPETLSPPHTFDTHRLADTLAQALPPLSNRTLKSLLGRLDGDHAIDDAARAALRVLHGRPDDPARAAAERRHHDRAFRAALAQQQAAGVPLTEAAQRRTFARVVLAALPPLVERTRTFVPAGPRPRPGRQPQPARHLRPGAAGPDAPATSPERRRRAGRGPPGHPPGWPRLLTRWPVQTATVNGRFRILDPERGNVLPELNSRRAPLPTPRGACAGPCGDSTRAHQVPENPPTPPSPAQGAGETADRSCGQDRDGDGKAPPFLSCQETGK